MAFAIDRSRTIISAMILGRRVTAQDVAWLKREVFASGEVSRESADELFAVVRAEMDNAPEWKEFFVDMIAEHVVRQAEPPGRCQRRAGRHGFWRVPTNASRLRPWPRWSMCAPRRIARRTGLSPRPRSEPPRAVAGRRAPRCAQRRDSLSADLRNRRTALRPMVGARYRIVSAASEAPSTGSPRSGVSRHDQSCSLAHGAPPFSRSASFLPARRGRRSAIRLPA